MSGVLDVIVKGLELLVEGAKLIPRAVLKPFKVELPQPGIYPFHVFTQPGTALEAVYGPNRCLHCARRDVERDPYQATPCPRTRLFSQPVELP